MPDNKEYIKDDYIISFHSASSEDYKVIVASYSSETNEVFSQTSWTGSQGLATGDFPRYTEFSSSFGWRWLQPFSGSDDFTTLKNIEISRWNNAGTLEYFDARNQGASRTHNPSIGTKQKFTKDGKLYTGRTSYDGTNTMPMGVIEYVSSSADKKWKINDFIVAGTASFSTVPTDRQRLNYSQSVSADIRQHHRSVTGQCNQWDVVDVITPGRPDGGKEKCLVIQSDRRFWKHMTDHSKGPYPPNSSPIGNSTMNHGWQYLIYKSGAVEGWYQETILDPRDLETFQFDTNGSSQRINARENINSNWGLANGQLWIASDPDSPSASGNSLGNRYIAKNLLAYTASYDGKLRLATLIGPHASSYKNKYIIIHASSSVGGWAVEDFVYAGKIYYTDTTQNNSFVYNQKRNEFYVSNPISSNESDRNLNHIAIIASASTGVYYTPGTTDLSNRGGFLNSTQGGVGLAVTSFHIESDITNSTELKSKKTDRLTLKELGLSNNLGSDWGHKEEWFYSSHFGDRMVMDDDGRLFVATYGYKQYLYATGSGTLRRSGYNKVYILNNNTADVDYNPHTSSAGWYIEDTIIDHDYTSGGKLSDKDETWYDEQRTGLSGPTRRKYYYGAYGASIAVPQFQEQTPYLFVGAPNTMSKNTDHLMGFRARQEEPRGCGYLYKSGSINGWTLEQKFENPTNFLSSSTTSPDDYSRRDDALQFENGRAFTGVNDSQKRLDNIDGTDSKDLWYEQFDNGFGNVAHGFSGSVLAVGTPTVTLKGGSEDVSWYPFQTLKLTEGMGDDYSSSALTTLAVTGGAGGSIIIYDGNAEYTAETVTTREVSVKDGPVPGRVGNIRGPFNIRGQSAEGSYRVSIGDKKK
jgi:hypothetical protein